MIARSLRSSVLATITAAALTTFAQHSEAIPLLNGFGGPSGYGLATNCVAPNDDGSYGRPIDLRPAFPGGLRFFGATYSAFFLNTNGNITFRDALYTYTPQAFPVANQPMIAPWWGDVDTRGGGQPTRNNICFHIEPNRIVITWNNVGYYSSHNDLLNNFQLVLSTSATCATAGDFDVEFRYDQCRWTTGDASGGTNGLGGTPAQVGFDAGNRMDYVSLPMSRTMAILDVCRSSNVPGGEPGLWRFQIRGGGVAGGCTGAGQPCTVAGQRGACAQGLTICSGMGTTCQQVNMPRPARCNGNDNDCDGQIDEADTLCPTGQVCDRGSCVDRCMPELGCLQGRTCTSRGTCIETACVDVMCPAGQRCSGGSCVGVCDGVMCPHGQMCRAGRCVDPCAGITCDPRDVCVQGQCVPGCQCRPCAAGQTCQPDGYCVDDGCIGVTCPTGTYCANGMCRDSCETGPDGHLCPEGEVCQTGECVPGRSMGTDAGTSQSDGGTTTEDGGHTASDAGRTDGGSQRDGGTTTRRDGGTFIFPADRGCACHTAGTSSTKGTPLAMLGLAAGIAAITRRRRSRR